MIPTYFFIVLLAVGTRSSGCQRALEWLTPTPMVGGSPTDTEPSTRQREAPEEPPSRGVGTRQECTPDLAAGIHDPVTKTPARARVGHGIDATAPVLTKIDTAI